MSPISRRGFLAALSAGTAAAGLRGNAPAASPGTSGPETLLTPVPLIHVTDLFRPHADPDDHWDLATLFALAHQGRIELRGVIIDYPPADFNRDPDVLAVAQMNRITGLAVPVAVGSPRRMDEAEAVRPESRAALSGVHALIQMMRTSSRPVAISVVGSARDVAMAGRLEPRLFSEKCAGVYLNAGSGTPDPGLAARREYNVALDPASYAGIFDLPCPVFWLPCFEVAPGGHGESFVAGPRGTLYRFIQKDILPHLSPRLQNYFAFMFKQGDSEKDQVEEAEALRSNWLRTLDGPLQKEVLARQGERERWMWSTAGFFHAAGLTVTAAGEIVPRDAATPALFSFDPVRVACDSEGITRWEANPSSRTRYLFRVHDAERYPAAMTAALRTLLKTLP
jgi:hypothetical protein